MSRLLLHGMSTVAGLIVMQAMHASPMWMRMMMYAGSWVACAMLYVPVLYVREHVADALDERMRRVVRDELERRDLLDYQRRVERERGRNGDDAAN